MIRIMKASAGSGKTFNLARKYITLLFSKDDRFPYRHILAVTFTNKATDEMKSRILKELYTLSSAPLESPYLKWFIPEMFSEEQMKDVDTEDIVRELPGHKGMKITPEALQARARELLCCILHDYSAFSISTIDRFFQQTLKAFTKEIGQFASYQVEIDKDALLDESVDRLLDSLTEDSPELLKWLTDCAMEQVEKGEKYNIDKALRRMAGRAMSDARREAVERGNIDEKTAYSYGNLQKIRKLCREVRAAFAEKVRTAAQNALDAIGRCGLTVEDFSRKFPAVLQEYAVLKDADRIEAPASFISRASDSGQWFRKAESAANMEKSRGLETQFEEFCSLFGDSFKVYNTAGIIISQLYDLGVISDIDREFEALLREKNVLSIDDSNLLLKNIIDGSDAPFVYEKTGVRYENFLLDEFQDTSGIQWENFRPLLENSEAQNFENLVVGDVKQSIYRWRGSDWKLLHEGLEKDMKSCRTTVLDRNFRSLRNIVEFNNSFFTFAANELDHLYGTGQHTISDIYSDVRQDAASAGRPESGMVKVTFCRKQAQTEYVLKAISDMTARGIRYGEIAVLVRGNDSGSVVAGQLVAAGIPVITDDSLAVKSSLAVRRLASLMTCIDSPGNTAGSFLAGSLETGNIGGYRSLADLCESLIRYMKENGSATALDSEATYVQAFVDCVLEYSSRNGNSLHGFLEYWEGADPHITSPALRDAVRVITVHKSKGLDFNYVIFPFAETVNLFRPSDVWCLPDFRGTGLEEAGRTLFDVRLSKESADTLFDGDFDRERLMQYIDNLNIFYVALTRAVRGMHIIADIPTKRLMETLDSDVPAYSGMSHILYTYLHRNGVKAGFRAAGDTEEGVAASFVRGEMQEKPQAENTGAAPETVGTAYPSFPLNPSADQGRSRLILSTDNSDCFPEDGKAELNSTMRMKGIVLHKILASVETSDDLGRAVDDAAATGLIDVREAEEVRSLLEGKIRSVASYGWFDTPGVRILNECSVIDSDGNIYRPDRVVLGPDGTVTVIDYKFGSRKNSYLRQVSGYASMWRRRGCRNVSAYLWYVLSDEVEKVSV